MNPLRRAPQNKRQGASKFRQNVGRTKAKNLQPPPMRGGYRL